MTKTKKTNLIKIEVREFPESAPGAISVKLAGDLKSRQEERLTPPRKAPNGLRWVESPPNPAAPENHLPAPGAQRDDQSNGVHTTGSSAVLPPAQKLILVHRRRGGEVEPIKLDA